MGKRLGVTRKFNKTNIEDVPDRTGIYLIKSERGEPRYLGISKKLKTRLEEHLNQKDIPGGHTFQTRTVRSRAQAAKLEREYISRLRPKYNILKKK